MNTKTLKLWTEILTTWIGAVALLAAGWFGVYQYLDKKRDDRIKETLGFLDRYNEGAVLDARKKISAVWRKNEAEQTRILADTSLPPNAFYDFTKRVIQNENLPLEISHLHDFFATLYICVQNQICEKTVALPLFKPDARALYHQHYAYIMEERAVSRDASVGDGLEKFSRLEN